MAAAWMERSVGHAAEPVLPDCGRENHWLEGHGDPAAHPADQGQDPDHGLLCLGWVVAVAPNPGLSRCGCRCCDLRGPAAQACGGLKDRLVEDAGDGQGELRCERIGQPLADGQGPFVDRT